MQIAKVIFNPAGLAAVGLLGSWVIGLTGPEHNIPYYNYIVAIPLLLIVGSFFLVNKVKTRVLSNRKNSKFLFWLALFAMFINLFQLTRIIPIYFSGNVNLRVVENALSGTPILTQLSLLYVPYMLNFSSIKNASHKESLLYKFCLLSIFIIPLKTYLLGLFIMLLLSNIEENKVKLIHVVSFGFLGLILIPLISILRVPKEYRETMFESNEAVIEYSLDELRYYTSYNIANLTLELTTSERRNGLNIFGQLIDPVVYFATMGENRLIQRNRSQGGIYHVLDGRKVQAFKKGVNMSTAFRAFIYDFGITGVLIGVLTYILLAALYFKLRHNSRYKTLRITLLMVGLFCFWDWDLFETRYIFWCIISLL